MHLEGRGEGFTLLNVLIDVLPDSSRLFIFLFLDENVDRFNKGQTGSKHSAELSAAECQFLGVELVQ